ncbi:MAG: REP-associated tyrosine transposase [Candidatus Acidiferrales bacterium]
MPDNAVTRRADANPQSPAAPAAGKRIRASKKAWAGLLFLTTNTYRRLPIFKEYQPCQLFFKEIDFYRTKFDFELYGYVLMPDHFHLLLHFPPDRDFAAFLCDFKSAVARLILDWVQENGRTRLLKQMQVAQKPKRHRDSRYAVFQANSYIRRVTSSSMFKQKLDYIHDNPLREKLVARAIDYPYSSLRNYEFGKGPVKIDWHGMILR